MASTAAVQTLLCQEIIPRLLFLTLFDSPFTSHSLFFSTISPSKSNMLVKREAWSNSPLSSSRFCHAVEQLQTNDLSLSKAALGFRGEWILFFPIQLTANKSSTEDTGLFFLGKLLASCLPPVLKLPPQSHRWQQSGVQQTSSGFIPSLRFLLSAKAKMKLDFSSSYELQVVVESRWRW